MFVTVHHLGSRSPLRLAPGAIAYLSADGEAHATVHLIGGETLRLVETVQDLEALAAKKKATAPMTVKRVDAPIDTP